MLSADTIGQCMKSRYVHFVYSLNMFADLRNPYSHLVFTGDKKEGEAYAFETLQNKL